MASVLERLLPQVGDTLRGQYVLKGTLGQGGFAIVFRANNLNLNEDVAIKVLLPHVMSNASLAPRFQREVALAKGLRHPNTIRILDYGETDNGLPYYVMEYVRGATLNSVLHRKGPISPERARHVSVQILKSLAEAHSQGIVHRDLKPENALICEIFGETDFVKVLDFGIAKALGNDDMSTMTQTDVLMGTPNYMSPEQSLGSKNVDARSDIYTMGLILAECLTGRPVVGGDTILRILATHAGPDPLSLEPPAADGPLNPIIAKACAKKPDDRYPSATAMIDALESLGPLSDEAAKPRRWATTLDSGARPSAHSHLDVSLPWITPLSIGIAPSIETPTEPDVLESASDQAGAPVEAPPPRGALRAAAMLLGFGLIAGGVVAGLTLGADDAGDAGETAPVANAAEAISPAAVAGTPGIAEPEPLPEPAPEPPVEPSSPTDAPDPLALANDLASFAVAHERVGHAVPAQHAISVGGTAGALVFNGDELLGQVPFELNVPLVDAAVSLRAERRGYRDTTFEVSFAESEVEATLRRAGQRRTNRPPTNDGPAAEPEAAPNPFGGAPIHRTTE